MPAFASARKNATFESPLIVLSTKSGSVVLIFSITPAKSPSPSGRYSSPTHSPCVAASCARTRRFTVRGNT